ncbi:hypothetical protein [Hominenteromicrobium sp.]|uniref:hypothetical protein n=1 Tax=Hominenteromicrobium sp. TaxID=3073581 RepID=UPI003A939852
MDIKADAYIALTMCISARWGRERSKIVIWVKRKTSETEVPEVLVGANGLEPGRKVFLKKKSLFKFLKSPVFMRVFLLVGKRMLLPLAGESVL